MAERRMFAKTIIDSDAFLDMPLSTQALYFHLSMRADDDGFINNPKKLTRMLGASDDELKVLFAKKFVIGFESGVIVIKHWRIHNYIQKDRYKKTNYTDEMGLLEVNEINGYSLDTSCVQVADTGKDRLELGKDRLGENNMCDAQIVTAEQISDFDLFWKHYPKKVGKDKAKIAWDKKKDKPPIEEIMKSVYNYITSKPVSKGFVCLPTTWINEGRWHDEHEQAQVNGGLPDGVNIFDIIGRH